MISAPARIGINALFLESGMGGLETYVREVVPRLARAAPDATVTVIVNPHGHAVFREVDLPANVEVEPSRLLGQRGLRAISEMTLLGAVASRRFDVLLNVALTAPLWTRSANVVLLADVTWLIYPDLADGGSRTLALWRSVVPRIARRADRVIALTNAGADEIAGRLHVERDRIDVVSLGRGSPRVDPTSRSHLEHALGLGGGPVVLNVAAKKAHKNLVRLVEAMPRVVAAVPDAQLVLPGAPTPYEDELRRRAAALGVDRNVHFPGFVSARDLEGLYAIADCFAFPSANEGFGLPVLEAMDRRVPVVCADASALPEVAGDAAILVDPNDAAALGEAIVHVLTDPALAADLRDRGIRQAERFTWDRCAAETLRSLERAVAGRHRDG